MQISLTLFALLVSSTQVFAQAIGSCTDVATAGDFEGVASISVILHPTTSFTIFPAQY